MKRIILITLVLLLIEPRAFSYIKWEDSPNNYENSPTNWQNSSSNWDNSPSNWNNSSNNPDANIYYDSNGNAKGYIVPKNDEKGANIYNFDGKRKGYYNY